MHGDLSFISGLVCDAGMTGRADITRRRILASLAEQPLFAALDTAALAALADQMEWYALGGGCVLFDQNEASDGLFLLVYGRLGAVRREADGRLRELGTISPGECVGETGLLAGEPRYARIVALRDSELLFLPRSGFEQLASLHPDAMLKMIQLVLRRFYATRGRNPPPNCFALLPAMGGVDVAGLAHRLAQALGGYESIELIGAESGREQPAAWFAEREAASRHLLYVGDEDPGWRERCVRQSDAVLLLVDASRPPQLIDRLSLPARSSHVPLHLVFLQKSEPRPGSTREWRERLPQAQAHHHVRNDTDLARLVRRLSGHATGLVLSGGGARGFAHLGAIRALHGAGYVFDWIGGASIGAIVGAGLAADWNDEQMAELYREHFVTTDPLADWTLPLVSLRSGAQVSRRLRAAFGNREIDDLPLPFFCVSSNLSDGALEVHEHGPLWTWLRASSAIPGILPPVFSAGRVLVDGGVIDNLPVGEMRRRMPGDIVAIDVGGQYRLQCGADETELPGWWRLLPELFGRRSRPGIGEILLRSGMVNSAATAARRRKQTKLLLSPPLDGIDLLDWKAFDRAVAAGYEYTCRRLESAAP
jgi:NTE family protein